MGDYDGDGKLDLFVPGHVHYDMANLPASGSKTIAGQFFMGTAMVKRD
jgi:hypothetical protein